MTNSQDYTIAPKPAHKGIWIPHELRKLGLSAIESMLLSTIDFYDHDAPNYCYASNKHLSELTSLSESRVSFYITKFKRMGLIEEVFYTGRRRHLRCLKQNWYVSNKDLCVKTRNQTTRFHEVSTVDDAATHIGSNKELEKTTTEHAVAAAVSSEKKKRTSKRLEIPKPDFPSLKEARCNDLSEQNKVDIVSDCVALKKCDKQLSQALDCAYAEGVVLKKRRVAYIRSALKKGYESPQVQNPGMAQALEYNGFLEQSPNLKMREMAASNEKTMKQGYMHVCDQINGHYTVTKISIKNALRTDWAVYIKALNELLQNLYA